MAIVLPIEATPNELAAALTVAAAFGWSDPSGAGVALSLTTAEQLREVDPARHLVLIGDPRRHPLGQTFVPEITATEATPIAGPPASAPSVGWIRLVERGSEAAPTLLVWGSDEAGLASAAAALADPAAGLTGTLVAVAVDRSIRVVEAASLPIEPLPAGASEPSPGAAAAAAPPGAGGDDPVVQATEATANPAIASSDDGGGIPAWQVVGGILLGAFVASVIVFSGSRWLVRGAS